MEIRYFQIIIPIVCCWFIYFQYKRYSQNKSGLSEMIITVFFWIGIVFLALFPDIISKFIASLFGIKDNINALILFKRVYCERISYKPTLLLEIE